MVLAGGVTLPKESGVTPAAFQLSGSVTPLIGSLVSKIAQMFQKVETILSRGLGAG